MIYNNHKSDLEDDWLLNLMQKIRPVSFYEFLTKDDNEVIKSFRDNLNTYYHTRFLDVNGLYEELFIDTALEEYMSKAETIAKQKKNRVIQEK